MSATPTLERAESHEVLAVEAPNGTPIIILEKRKAIDGRKVYKKLKKELKRKSKKKTIDFTVLAALIYRAYRIVVKYAISPEKMAEMLGAFARLFAVEQVTQFLDANPDWILNAIKLTSDVVIAAIGAM